MDREFSCRRFFLAACALACAAHTCVGLAAAEPADERRLLAGLRERRLFFLAEGHCRRELAAPDLTEVRRASLVAEWAETLADHARHAAPAERDSLWLEAAKTCDDYLATHAEAPRAVLVRVQRALVLLARGEMARQEAELAAGAAERVREARDALRESIRTLSEAAQAIEKLMPAAARSADRESGELTVRELAALADNVEYRLARAYRNQGQSYPPDSDDRLNSLELAQQSLERVQKRSVVDRLTWPALVDTVICRRLAGDLEGAATLLENALQARPAPPATAVEALRAEQLRVHLDQGEIPQALALAARDRQESQTGAGEFDFACIEAYVAAWREAAAQERAGAAGSRARQWQERTAGAIRDIEARHGGYWRRRAAMLLASAVGGDAEVESADVMIGVAEEQFRAEQFDLAIESYDRAFAAARKSGEQDAAFRAANAAAHIEQKQRRHADAQRRFRELALAFPEHPQASEAHLLAIFNAAQAAKQRPAAGAADDPKTYADLLHEHLSRWPEAHTAGQARLWLGRLCELQRDWAGAVEAFQAVPIDPEKHAEALAGLERAYRAWLADLRSKGKPLDAVARQAAEGLEATIVGSRGEWPERWSPAQRQAALSAAEIWLVRFPDQSDRAQRILEAALANAAESDRDATWKSSAHGLLALAQAAQGDREQAERTLEEVRGQSPAALLAVVEGLDRLVSDAADGNASLAPLQLRMAERLLPDRAALDADEQGRLDLMHVSALAAAGRRDEALKKMNALAEAAPQDGAVQEALALLLASGKGRKESQDALAKWRQVGQKSRPGGERWLRAAYYQALLLDRLGQREEAVRKIKFVRNQYPDLGGGEIERKFLDLLQGPRALQ